MDGLGLVHGAQFREHESTFEVLRSFGKVFFLDALSHHVAVMKEVGWWHALSEAKVSEGHAVAFASPMLVLCMVRDSVAFVIVFDVAGLVAPQDLA